MTAVIEASRPAMVTRGGVNPRLQPAAHLVHLFAKIPRNVPHLRDPVAVVLHGPKGSARRVAEIRPERGIRIGGHLIVAETLIGDQCFDLRAIDVVVELLGGRKFRPWDRIELAEHVLPRAKPHLLGRRIDLRQMILNRLLRVFIVGELLIAPLPLGRVDRLQASIGRVGP